MNDVTTTDIDTRIAWVEPAVTFLDVAETSAFPTRGLDGAVGQPDCTRS